MASKIDPTQVTLLKQFIAIVSAKPEMIHLPELSFFKDWLKKLGATIPEPEPEPKPEPKPEPTKEEGMDSSPQGATKAPDKKPEKPVRSLVTIPIDRNVAILDILYFRRQLVIVPLI